MVVHIHPNVCGSVGGSGGIHKKPVEVGPPWGLVTRRSKEKEVNLCSVQSFPWALRPETRIRPAPSGLYTGQGRAV